MDLGALIRPWAEVIARQVPDLVLFDAHTHVGQNDPDGMKCTPEELLAILRAAGARGCFVFPMHEPEGYPPANDAVLEAAREIGEEFVPFCRVSPHAEPIREAERCLDAGARGIKLHPRAEEFTLDHPEVQKLAALADERTLPILIHAGRGIPALGRHAVELASRYPNARLILAHAAICDLSWLWRVAPDHPNLLFDTSWFMPADLRTLFSLVPPGQILFASDAPYGATSASAVVHLRYALQAGMSPEQVRSVAGGQALRIASGAPLEPAGPAVGEHEQAQHVLLERVLGFLMFGIIVTFRMGDGNEFISLARQSAEVPPEVDDAPVFAAIIRLIDAYEAMDASDPTDRRRVAPLILAAAVAATPDVPLPAGAAEQSSAIP